MRYAAHSGTNQFHKWNIFHQVDSIKSTHYRKQLIFNKIAIWHAIRNCISRLKTMPVHPFGAHQDQYTIHMNNVIRSLATAVLLARSAVTVHAQSVATSAASVAVVTPISIVKTSDMSFGRIAVNPASSGTVVMAPSGTRTTGGAGGVTLPSTAGVVSSATFLITGFGSYSYTITLPTVATISDGSANIMTVNGFTSTPSAIGMLGSGGTSELKIGATLNVSAGQSLGMYKNSSGLPVTVNYY